jgi:hypothetical protein
MIQAMGLPLIRYFGEHQLEEIVGNFTVTFLLGLAIAKILAIYITVISGRSDVIASSPHKLVFLSSIMSSCPLFSNEWDQSSSSVVSAHSIP